MTSCITPIYLIYHSLSVAITTLFGIYQYFHTYYLFSSFHFKEPWAIWAIQIHGVKFTFLPSACHDTWILWMHYLFIQDNTHTSQYQEVHTTSFTKLKLNITLPFLNLLNATHLLDAVYSVVNSKNDTTCQLFRRWLGGVTGDHGRYQRGEVQQLGQESPAGGWVGSKTHWLRYATREVWEAVERGAVLQSLVGAM